MIEYVYFWKNIAYNGLINGTLKTLNELNPRLIVIKFNYVN